MGPSTAPTRSRADGHIGILGASTRAFAASAARAGWQVSSADLFCDLDLQAISRSAVAVPFMSEGDIPGYPWNLLAAAAGFPSGAAWCYTGAVENHPDLIDALARVRPLAGNSGACVRRLRDPAALAAAARAADLLFPETHASPDGVPLDGTWLVKPLAGGGGRGIRPWTRAEADERRVRDRSDHAPTPPAKRIWQRFVEGAPVSASYCFDRRRVRLLGICRQLIGESWCNASPFAWCGAVTLGPTEAVLHGNRLAARLERLGDVLAEIFQPVGLMGVDLIVDGRGNLSVIEVNPRPTASMELVERLGVASMASCHLAACGHALRDVPADERPRPATANAWAKAVLFTRAATPITRTWLTAINRETEPWNESDGGWPALADIPRPGQTIAAGSPVLTLFAAAGSSDAALATLRDRVVCLDARLSASRQPCG